MFKNYSYTAPDGVHFPDAHVGDDLYYAIDFDEWLAIELDTITSVEWVLPNAVTSSEEFLVGKAATIKLLTNKTGTHKVTCKLTSSDNGKMQTNAIPMMLRVY